QNVGLVRLRRRIAAADHLGDGRHRELRSDLPADVAAHAVADDVKANRRIEKHRIFVLLADKPDVGLACALDVKGHGGISLFRWPSSCQRSRSTRASACSAFISTANRAAWAANFVISAREPAPAETSSTLA